MFTKRIKRALGVVCAGLLTTLGLSVTSAPNAAAVLDKVQEKGSDHVTADALPTVQINRGVVWETAIAGDIVYAGGSFSQIRPAGAAPNTSLSSRGNMVAFNINNGVATSFNPALNGEVKAVAVSPDGKRLFVGGAFSSASGQPRTRIASYDLTSGSPVLTGFAPAVNGPLYAITATNTTVYVGGNFTRIGGTTRYRLAAFDFSGRLLGWAPSADGSVSAMTMSPDKSKVIIGGHFAKLNGSQTNGMGSIGASNGWKYGWAISNVVKDYGATAAILSLKADGNTVYGGGYKNLTNGNFEGVFAADPNTGAIRWLADCHGDTYDVEPMNSYVYAVDHHHTCQNIGSLPEYNPRRHIHADSFTKAASGKVATNTEAGYYTFGGQPATTHVDWFPNLQVGTYTGINQAAWTNEAKGNFLVVGGEFPRVNNKYQQGLVRFATKGTPGNPSAEGPIYGGTTSQPTLQAMGNAVKISWKANVDLDNKTLTYRIYREGTATPLYEWSTWSIEWYRPTMSWIDTGVDPSRTYRYKVVAVDPDGNAAHSAWVSVTTPATVTLKDAYYKKVVSDLARSFWTLDDARGATRLADVVGGNNMIPKTGVIMNNPGYTGRAQEAGVFNGTANGTAGAQTAQGAINTFSIEAWFKTTSTVGGKIVGFGNSQTATSSVYDRHIYVDNAGRVVFGVNSGGAKVLASAPGLNNGNWHHVVATLSSAGMRLYVDGAQVGSSATPTAGQAYTGYWRIGGDNVNGWPYKPSSPWLNGTIDNVAIYSAALSASQVSSHYTLAKNVAPVASFTKACTGLTCNFTSTSTDSDGTIAAYAWDFDNNGTVDSTLPNPSKTFAAGGTYPVKLTVTDNLGASASTTQAVTLNKVPVASFTSSCTALTCTFTSTSTDPDGTIASLAWDFNVDNVTDSTVSPTTHTFASPGSHPVKLTVTDNSGATASVTIAVTTTAPVTVAADSYGTDSASGWAPATTGGSYTYSNSTGDGVASASGVGTISLSSAGTTSAVLASASATNTTSTADLSFVNTSGAALSGGVVVRNSAAGQYQLDLSVSATGDLSLVAKEVAGSTVTTLKTVSLGSSYTAGDQYRLVATVSGGTITMKAWKVGTTAPTAPQLSVTDDTPLAAGSVGLSSTLDQTPSGTASVSFDNYSVTNP